MREREELRYIQRYKFALIRVRFPDGVYLQGTFSVYEKLEQAYAFVQSCLKNENLEFRLMSPIGAKWDDEDMNKSLFDLRYDLLFLIAPCMICHFLIYIFPKI